MSRPGQSALVVLLLQAVVGGEEPSLEHSLTTPVIRQEGQDALLTCVANHQANYTLMWKRAEKDKVLQDLLQFYSKLNCCRLVTGS